MYRVLLFHSNGPPASVLTARTLTALPPPSSSSVLLKFLQAPVNPSDINVIQGVYPSRPSLREGTYFVPGNEGLAQVIDRGSDVKSLRVGDWVIMAKAQLGTWASHANVHYRDVVPLPDVVQNRLLPAHAATMAVNPPTALNLLTLFTTLKQGDWIVQNAANSAVGKAVIQIAKKKGYKTINFVRNRPDIEILRNDLQNLGGTYICTYDDLQNKEFRNTMKHWTDGADIRLALNCVGGAATSRMASLLGSQAHLVSYGAMSKEPLSLPTSLFIFKDLKAHGYWQSRWYENCSEEQRATVMSDIIGMMVDGSLQAPQCRSIILQGSDDDITTQVRKLMSELTEQPNVSSLTTKQDTRKILFSWA